MYEVHSTSSLTKTFAKTSTQHVHHFSTTHTFLPIPFTLNLSITLTDDHSSPLQRSVGSDGTTAFESVAEALQKSIPPLPLTPHQPISQASLTGPIVSNPTSVISYGISPLSPHMLTQTLLSSALRRIGLSGSVAKSLLADRLSQAGVTDSMQIINLVTLWEEHITIDAEVQTNACPAGAEQGRAPNWTKDETVGHSHFIADPRHAITVLKTCQRIDSLSESDTGRNDPFGHVFVHLFNDTLCGPDNLEAVCGISDYLLLHFDPSTQILKRNSTILKQIWGTLRSLYTLACENYNKSGQGDPSTFSLYTNGDDSLLYMPCVFFNNPSLDAVVGNFGQMRKLRPI